MSMPPTPSARLAAMRTDAPSGAVAGGWLYDSVIVMIMACLNRLFARLDAMLLLWQAGQLPPPHPRAASKTAPRQNFAAAARPSRARRRRMSAPHRARPRAAPIPATVTSDRPPHALGQPPSRPRATHDPPASAENPLLRRRRRWSNLLRYRNIN